MSAGRKPLTAVANVADANLDQPKIDNAMVQMRADGAAERVAHDTGIFDLGRQVGAIQMAQVQRDFCAVAQLKLFEEIKESNKYKDLAIRHPDGSCATAQNLEEFCRLVFGNSYRVMAEASQNLKSLGESSYEAANRLGLNRKQLRLIRSLPAEQQTDVQEAIQSESKAEVVAVIEDLAAQLAQANDDIVEAKKESAAKDQVLADKNASMDKLRAQVKRVQAAAPDDVLADLCRETAGFANEAMGMVQGRLRQGFVALTDHHATHGGDSKQVMAGYLGQLQVLIHQLREEFMLPDTVGDGTPEWQRWADAQDAAAGTDAAH